MSNINSVFTSSYLHQARESAKAWGVKLPKRITAYKVGRYQYAVQAEFPYNYDHYFDAYEASEAKAKFINSLIEPLYPLARDFASPEEYRKRVERLASLLAE